MNKDLIIENIEKFSLQDRKKSNKDRAIKRNRLYLSEIIDKEKPKFTNNNLILAPVGSGKSHLIENTLIPKDYKGKILYLVSTSALKDSIAPEKSKYRKELAAIDKSKGFYTTGNNKRFGDVPYSVHVMTYHEFGKRIVPAEQTFTDDYKLIFCDEIHSVEVYSNYANSGRELNTAARWLFKEHKDKVIYHFTATNAALEETEKRYPGYTKALNVFNYLDYPNIVKYQAKSTYYIRNTYQLKEHLDSKVEYIIDKGHKGLAFTRRIDSQNKIAETAKKSGYTPIAIWSKNNDDKEMNDEQVRVRDYLLRTGNIPDPYNLLIINSSMQEGWNLNDHLVEFAILDTLDETERVQALGRIRKDIDFLILKVKDNDSRANKINIPEKYLDTMLTPEDKDILSKDLNIKNNRGDVVTWRTIKKLAEESGYTVEDKVRVVDRKRRGVSFIRHIRDI